MISRNAPRHRSRSSVHALFISRGAALFAVAGAVVVGVACGGAPSGDVPAVSDTGVEGAADVAEPEWTLDSGSLDTTTVADSAPADVCANTICGGACIDTASDSRNCGACGHDCLGGSCSGGVCQSVVISTEGTQVMSLRIDDSDIYWFERSGCIGCERLMRAPRTGATTPVVIASDQKSPSALNVRKYDLYWTEPTEGTIRSVAKSGLYLTTNEVGQDYPSFLTFDGDEMYWANYGRNKLAESLWRRPTTGWPIKLASTSGPIVVDDAYVYWLEWAVYPADQGSIRRVSKSGTGETTLTTLKGEIRQWLKIVGSDLYWLLGDDLYRMPKTGGTPTKIQTIAAARGMAFESDGIYVTDTKSVSRVPVGGGTAVKLLEDPDLFSLAAVDDKAIVYVTHTGLSFALGYSIKLRAK